MGHIDYVNVLQGTKSIPRFSHGNTLPLTQLPFAMNGFVPQTCSNNGSWFFHPDHRSIEGIRLSHQPSPWVGDYGCFNMLPVRGDIKINPDERWSGYRPENAVLRPNYLSVDLLRYRARFELTPTERGAAGRISYDGEEERGLLILPVKDICAYEIDFEKSIVKAYVKAVTAEAADNFAMYFTMSFGSKLDKKRCFIIDEDGCVLRKKKARGNMYSLHIGFKDSCCEFKLATSYISVEQAQCNLESELAEKSFDEIEAAGEKIWEEHLAKIEIETDNEKELRTFYSCMYRSFLFPRKFYEYDKSGEAYHFCPDSGRVMKGVKYVDNGFWDTYRTVYPLLSIIMPDTYAEMLEGFINTYRSIGWLPKWPCPSEGGMMPGTLIDAVIADGAVKGVASRELINDGLLGMLKHAGTANGNSKYGRQGVEEYIKLGYIPWNKYNESVNNTLDSAYGDFCIAQTAAVLNDRKTEKRFRERAKNYSRLFDSESGFIRARDEAGNFKEGFSPFAWGGEYCEGGPWQTSFAVPHDLKGLARLHGGKEKLLNKLDELFHTAPRYEVGGYGMEIHEMTEMASVDFGQCAISNQPCFHIPYIYAYFGETEKSRFWVRKMREELFSFEADGFPGDEDNGTMAAWYIFSSLGIYPMCPGKPEYVNIGTDLKRAVIHSPGNSFVIEKAFNLPHIISHWQIVGGKALTS